LAFSHCFAAELAIKLYHQFENTFPQAKKKESKRSRETNKQNKAKKKNNESDSK